MAKTALFVGAGLSATVNIPVTSRIPEHFLTLRPTLVTKDPLQAEISNLLGQFWKQIFGYESGPNPPTFEDHFTLLDLAANAGHNLGRHYTPAKLRAIRRLSIHRVFDILNSHWKPNSVFDTFAGSIATSGNYVVVSTNWDVAIEGGIQRSRGEYNYGIDAWRLEDGSMLRKTGLPILKLQGSSNWSYCDSCHRLFPGAPDAGKTLLIWQTLIEKRDFRNLGTGRDLIEQFKVQNKRKCPSCHCGLSTRVATFSYAKAYGFDQFQSTWARALVELREASRWVFIGYSLPEADFEIRHLLKVAQLARKPAAPLTIEVAVGDHDEALSRYERFFGTPAASFGKRTFLEWWDDEQAAAPAVAAQDQF